MPMKMTQKDKILRHFRDLGNITPMEAIAQYGIMRLGARIWDLKRMGYPIETQIVYGKNRYGEPTRWASYSMRKEVYDVQS